MARDEIAERVLIELSREQRLRFPELIIAKKETTDGKPRKA